VHVNDRQIAPVTGSVVDAFNPLDRLLFCLKSGDFNKDFTHKDMDQTFKDNDMD